MVFELFLCELDGYIYIKSMLVIYFSCMSHYMDFNACFFCGDFSANECSCDISNWFEWKRTGDSREIYVCRCLGKLLQNADWGYDSPSSKGIYMHHYKNLKTCIRVKKRDKDTNTCIARQTLNFSLPAEEILTKRGRDEMLALGPLQVLLSFD